MDRLDKANLLLKLATPAELVAALRQHFQRQQRPRHHRSAAGPAAQRRRAQGAPFVEQAESLYLDREERLQAGQATQEVENRSFASSASSARAHQLAEGEVLGDRYRLIEVIGSGGFAKVWKAFDRRNNRSVAVKILHGDQGSEGAASSASSAARARCCS